MASKGTYKLTVEPLADNKESKKKRLKWSNLYTYSCARPFLREDKSLGCEGFSRVVLINRQDEHPVRYPTNWVSTTKYNLVTFLPKALYEQFRRIANIYFLLSAALSLTAVSPFSASSLIAPLAFVVGMSMVKEAIEDWHRFLQDKKVNNRKVLVHQGDGRFTPVGWKKVRVGDVVKVEKDNFFPADLLLLSS
eukprot:c3116_g1_i1 orf=1-576(-)